MIELTELSGLVDNHTHLRKKPLYSKPGQQLHLIIIYLLQKQQYYDGCGVAVTLYSTKILHDSYNNLDMASFMGILITK